MSVGTLATFTSLCLLLSLTPGPDTFLTLRCTMGGARGGLGVAVGSAAGSLVWATAVASGLAALLDESAVAYRLVKIVGGCYLLYLAVRTLAKPSMTATNSNAVTPVGFRRGLRLGAVSCALNPKVGLFFVAVVPQFVPASSELWGPVLLLGVLDALVAAVYLSTIALVTIRMVRWLRRPRVVRLVERTSAAVLAAFGIGAVASSVQ